jgi:hypothetical protein
MAAVSIHCAQCDNRCINQRTFSLWIRMSGKLNQSMVKWSTETGVDPPLSFFPIARQRLSQIEGDIDCKCQLGIAGSVYWNDVSKARFEGIFARGVEKRKAPKLSYSGINATL